MAAVQYSGSIDQTNDAAGKIVLPGVIQFRQLCGLAADQGAATLFACFCESGDQLIENHPIKTVSTDVVEKEQGSRAGHRDVVDAMVHQVLSNRRMLAERDRNFQLCSNSVDARHENRLLDSLEIRPEQPAKPAATPED